MALVKYNNNSISDVTALAGVPTGALTHIKTLTASSSASLSFVHGSSDVVFDSTYPIYVFKFINIHNDGDQRDIVFNGSSDSGSNYNVTKTSSTYEGLHWENDSAAQVSYNTGTDLAQSTGDQHISAGLGNQSDDNANGVLYIFNPSSTTFVKHFISIGCNNYRDGLPGIVNLYVGGYFNTTSAVNAIRFQMESGNIDSGTIKLYGIKDS